MTLQQPPQILKLLAHELRWSLLKALLASDYRVHELVDQVEQPANLVSYHLKQLRDEDVVHARRSDADGRDVYYSLDFELLRQRFLEAGNAFHPYLAVNLPNAPELDVTPCKEPIRVLFICTHNSARSQMAEGLLRAMGQDAFEVYSGGNQPTTVHPDAVRAMDKLEINIRGQQATHVGLFQDESFDYVITVCDKAREVCPMFPGHGQQLHWGFPDPAAVIDAQDRAEAFIKTARLLQSRIQYFMSTCLLKER